MKVDLILNLLYSLANIYELARSGFESRKTFPDIRRLRRYTSWKNLLQRLLKVEIKGGHKIERDITLFHATGEVRRYPFKEKRGLAQDPARDWPRLKIIHEDLLDKIRGKPYFMAPQPVIVNPR